MIDHHAVLLVGRSLAESGYIDNLPLETTELLVLKFETLSINDVRQIIQMAFAKPLSALTETIVIEANAITSEAQQALLKIMEEPPATTKFILVLASVEGLLPTLLSRLTQPQSNLPLKRETNSFFTIFQTSSYAARLECIARVTKDKDVSQIELLRTGVVWWLSHAPTSSQTAVLLDCVTRLMMRGASKKMLLEEIALTLPIVG